MCDNGAVTRLFRIFLAVLLALPATQAASHLPDAAPVHDMMMHDMMTHKMVGDRHDHGMPAPVPAAHHDCIGCIAPIDIRLYRPVSTPILGTALEARAADMTFLVARNAAPEPPPPRAAV